MSSAALIPMHIRWTIPPGNSQIVQPFCSTYRIDQSVSHGAFAAAAAAEAPGDIRGKWSGWTMRGLVNCTVQDVTVGLYIKTGNVGTSADWEIDAGPPSGTFTVTAATARPFTWRPGGSEFRMRVTAGATAPTTLYIDITLMPPGYDNI
jgi:hypothetical protein